VDFSVEAAELVNGRVPGSAEASMAEVSEPSLLLTLRWREMDSNYCLAGIGSSASLVPLRANRTAALAGHEHHTFKDRGEVAGSAYNHKTMPDWRVKRHRSVMNRRADNIERNAGENQPHCRRRHGH
jgi:hypothetical protein